MTADPLLRAWRSAMTHAVNLSTNDVDVLSGLTAEITALIQLRNDWSHGTWMIGYGDEAEWSSGALVRLKNSAKGVASPTKLNMAPSAEYIEKVASHVAVVHAAVFSFSTTVELLQDRVTTVSPSDRVQVVKQSGQREIRVAANGVDWRSSRLPQ